MKKALKKVEVISHGAHKESQDGVCVMEAAAYIAGEPWSDAPKCVSPLLTRTMVAWNDSLPDDESRTRLLTPLIPEILGTTAKADAERSRLVWEWMCRVYVPTWLDLVPSLNGHAAILRDCPIEDIVPKLLEARTASAAAGAAAWAAARDAAWDAAGAAAWAAARAAAWAAARDAAGAAAGDAAGAAAGDAAGDAAWAAAGDAAWAAAGGAAWGAAGDAAWAAAWAAARAAAWDALAPTVRTLQDSFSDLIRKMAALETRDAVPFARSLRVNGFQFEKGGSEAVAISSAP